MNLGNHPSFKSADSIDTPSLCELVQPKKVNLQPRSQICKFGRVNRVRLVDRVYRLDHFANSC